MDNFQPTSRTRLGRMPARAAYDRATVYAILDEAMICHVAFVIDGKPNVIATGFGRSGDTLYIHGSVASRMMRSLEGGIDVSIAVTLLDGLVLARSAFHHSMNYRSVVMYGRASLVADPDEKNAALRVFSDHAVPGRWDVVRPPTARELKATTVLAVQLDEVSAKVRTGPPIDDDEDMGLSVWAGVMPVRMVAGDPVADAGTPADAEPPGVPPRFLR